MGNSSSSSSSSSSSKISALDVLALVDKGVADNGGAPAPVNGGVSPEDDDLGDALAALGVNAEGVPVAEARRCWELVTHQDFWRNHFAAHPKKKRVKAWMFVHSRFRASGAFLVQEAEAMQALIVSGDERQETEALAKGVESLFRSLVSKIDKHSDFEDSQLFRFFSEHVPEIRDDIRDLEADHSEKQGENQAFALLKGLREGGGEAAAGEQATEAVGALKSYVASLEGHLEREERALVDRWLNLTPALYATYRTYLVGKYRFVY